MSAKVDKSGSATGGQKVSKFAIKAGFVIPKNKLSGSLVPVFRGDKNVAMSDHGGGESKNQVQRKTKWGADLSQDALVRKGRALSYQTRVDQITQQLKSGISEFGNNDNNPSTTQDPDNKSFAYVVDKKGAEELELEKREVIGEILKLNPSYKAPSDYRPLLKESTVPVPIKEYPTHNILGLIYGPGGDNQKQLEKETGAKIQVYGTKVATGEKVEIKQYASSKNQTEYEKLYVHVSADTFEKVYAAVAVIELLITSVSGNMSTIMHDKAHGHGQDQDTTTSTTIIDQGHVQPVAERTQTPPNVQFQYPGSFYSTGQPNSSGNVLGFTPTSSQAPIISNDANSSRPPVNSTTPALFPHIQHLPPPVLQQTNIPQTGLGSHGAPRDFSMMTPRSSSVQSNMSAPATLVGNQPPPSGQSNHPFGNPNWQLRHDGNSGGWSMPQSSTGISNNMHTAPNSLNHLNAAPNFASVARPQPFMNPMSGSVPAPPSGLPPPQQPRLQNFNPMKPPIHTASNPGDFTFQPHRPQNPVFQAVPQQSNQFSAHNAHSAGPLGRPQHDLSLQLSVQHMTPQPGIQVLTRPRVGDLISRPSTHISPVQFPRNSTGAPRLEMFPDVNPIAPRMPHMPMRPEMNFSQSHRMPNFPNHLPPMPGNHNQFQHGYQAQVPPNQQAINNQFAYGKLSNPGAHQLYDPFSLNSDSTAKR